MITHEWVCSVTTGVCVKKLLMILILLVPEFLFSQARIENFVADTMTLDIYFNEKPDYTAKLSESKRKITLTLAGSVDPGGELGNFSETGIFNSLDFERGEKSSALSIGLDRESGFTAAYFPYTKRIRVYAVDWVSLSAGDDHYHTGLLAPDLPEAAKERFIMAAEAGTHEAALPMGVLLMKEGKVNSAEQYLLFALQTENPEPDVFAALAQLYNLKGEARYEQIFRDKFKSRTGMEHIDYLPVPPAAEKGNFTPDSNTVMILDSLKKDSVILEISEKILEEQLSIQKYLAGDTKIKIDSANNERFKDILQTKSGDSTKGQDSFFADFRETLPVWLEIVLWAVLAAVLIVLYLYLKWRRDRMITLQKIQEQAFKKEMNQAKQKDETRSEKKSGKASEIYREQQRQAAEFKKIAEQRRENAKKMPPVSPEIPRSLPKSGDEKKAKGITESDKKQLEQMIADYRQSPPQRPTGRQKAEQLKSRPELAGDVEMALNMANEQKRMRRDNLKNAAEQKKEIKSAEKNEQKEKYSKSDPGNVETKKALDNLTEDEKYYSKLADKFGKKNTSDE